MSEQYHKRIFISHASVDSDIGEKLLDALIGLGINKDEVFYSSLYHTGVKLGVDFHNSVKSALSEVEIVVFLLTRAFYQSEYCLNEMGAVWLSNIRFVPILLDGITYNDMKGFIDSHYVAFTPDKNETYKLITELRPFISTTSSTTELERVFDDFIETANSLAAKNAQYLPSTSSVLSQTEHMVLGGRFVDDEILLMNYFAINRKNILNDVILYDQSTGLSEDSTDLASIKQYAKEFTFNFENAKSLLEQSEFLQYEYDWVNGSEDYLRCKLDINVFRDFISLTDAGKQYVREVLARHTLASSEKKIKAADSIHATESSSQSAELSTIESIILNPKFKELEALLLCYMLETSTNSLGDRWMENITIKNIKLWEEMNGLNYKLSRGYADALKMLKFRNLVDVASTTSYGNPREFKLKDEYLAQLRSLSAEAGKALEVVKNSNELVEDEPLPF